MGMANLMAGRRVALLSMGPPKSLKQNSLSVISFASCHSASFSSSADSAPRSGSRGRHQPTAGIVEGRR